MAELHTHSVSELSEKLKKKEVSSVELTTHFLGRAKKFERLNAYLELFESSALAQAKEADARIAKGEQGPLLGMPIAIKDLIVIKGEIASCASKMLANFRSPYDATVTKKLRAAGAVFLGRTNMDEFAMGGSNEKSAFGPVKNPWDETRVSGGSSGGSAAAVAARIAPIALGTDTGGSIRQPASLCGITGLKPTYGRVSRFGLVAFASSLDQIGSFSTTIDDTLTVLEAISGKDPHDATSMNIPVSSLRPTAEETTQGVKGLRIGIPKEYFVKGLDKEVETAVRAACSELEKQGAMLVEISLPHTHHAVATYYILAPAEASSNLARFDGVRYGHRATGTDGVVDLYQKTRAQGFGREVKRRIMIGNYVLSSGYFDAYYLQAQKVRSLIKRDFTEAFKDKCDLIACPTAPNPAFLLGEKNNDPLAMYLEDIFTIPASLAGLPGVSIPCGKTAKGLPIGLQLTADAWKESNLIRAARIYQNATNFHQEAPHGI